MILLREILIAASSSPDSLNGALMKCAHNCTHIAPEASRWIKQLDYQSGCGLPLVKSARGFLKKRVISTEVPSACFTLDNTRERKSLCK